MTTPNEYLTESAIAGCRHPLERRNEWNANGACPICLYASLAMANDTAKALRDKLADAQSLQVTTERLRIESFNAWKAELRLRAAAESRLEKVVEALRDPTKEMLIDGAKAVRDFNSGKGDYPRTRAMWKAMSAQLLLDVVGKTDEVAQDKL